MSRTETPHRVRDGARVIAPFAVAVGAFGVTFGVLARDAGLGGLKAVVFSATTFAGSAQFAVASILGAAGGVVSAAGPRLTNYPKGEKTSPVRQALGELAEHPRPKPGHTAGGPLPPRTGR